MPNTRQPISHSTTKATSAAIGCAMSAATRDQRRLLPAATASKDELPDTARGNLEFIAGLHVEVAWTGQPNIDDFCDAAGPRRHHHDPVCKQNRFGNRMR